MRPTAVTLDAYGTLLRLRDPVPRLSRALADEGYPNPEEQVKAGLRAEIDYYRANFDDGRDTASLHGLRVRCAAVIAAQLEHPPPILSMVELMLDSLVFELYPETIAALSALAGDGHRLAVVSNWDCSLSETLADLGILDRFAAVIDSASASARKPAPEIFREALSRLGVPPERAVHCGDTLEVDGLGARSAGMGVVLLSRTGQELPGWSASPVESLEQLPARVGRLLAGARSVAGDFGTGTSD